MAYKNIAATLKSQGLAPNKKLGQNFLLHRHTAERIVEYAKVTSNDIIIEVGVGLGALTVALAAVAGKVIGIEADSGIIRWHQEQKVLPQNVVLVHGDILKLDFAELKNQTRDRLKIVANLPYSISTPFLFKLMDNCELIDFAVVMLQKEVALRLTAQPGSKEYGVPSVRMASCGTAKILMHVKPGEFYPRPRVDSTVILLSFQTDSGQLHTTDEFDKNLFKRIVSCSFGKRRKTLLNGLAQADLVKNKTTLADLIHKAGISPSVRAEQLHFEEFVRLTEILSEYTKQNELM